MIIINFALLSESAHFSSVPTPHFAVKYVFFLIHVHLQSIFYKAGNPCPVP